MNSKEKLDTSERGTLVPTHSQNGIKNTEMASNQPKVDNCQPHHWENPRICCTCTHYHRHYCTRTVAPRAPEDRACTLYSPKQTD